MKRFALVGAVTALFALGGACGPGSGDAGDDTSNADTAVGDAAVTDTGDDDAAQPDAAATDTATPIDDTAVAPDTQGDDAVADTAVADSAVADTAVADATADTGADDAGQDTVGDTSAPECGEDADCAAVGIAPPPNECVVRRCVDGTCQDAARDCADSDPCTLDACDPHMGCVHPEPSYDVGSSRVWFCPGPLPEIDARAACSARGDELAYVVTAEGAAAYTAILGDFGAADAWVNQGSVNFCPTPLALPVPPCRALDAAGCTNIELCDLGKAFLCERNCNDGDPCTDDFVGADGLCAHDDASCDDANACTVDTCTEKDGCVHTSPEGLCDDGAACTTDTCTPATGACAHDAVHTTWDATHQLLACPGPLSWAAARARCAAEGAVLAMPVTAAHEAALTAISESLGATAALWAPLKQQDGGDQPWDWVDGHGSGAPPWCASVQPNFSEAGYCGEWSPADGCLLDDPCTELRSFGCVVDTSIP